MFYKFYNVIVFPVWAFSCGCNGRVQWFLVPNVGDLLEFFYLLIGHGHTQYVSKVSFHMKYHSKFPV